MTDKDQTGATLVERLSALDTATLYESRGERNDDAGY